MNGRKPKTQTVEAGESRWWRDGPIRAMACANGYVMARRPHCVPFVMSVKEWLALPNIPVAESNSSE